MQVLLIIAALLSLANSATIADKRVYAFGTKVALTTPIPIVRPPVEKTETMIPAATVISPDRQLPAGTPTLIPVTSTSPFLPSSSSPVDALLVLPPAPQTPVLPPSSPFSLPVTSSLNTEAFDVKEPIDEIIPTTTLPLTGDDVEAIKIAEITPPATPSTTTTTTIAPIAEPIVPTNRGIFQTVNLKFRDRINELVREIVDSVIEETKQTVHNSINTHLG